MVDNWPDTKFVYEPQTKKTLCNVEANALNIIGGVYGIKLMDQRRAYLSAIENFPLLFEIKNNDVNMTLNVDNTKANDGFNLQMIKDAVVRNNKFTGSGKRGVVATSIYDGFYTENAQFLDNDFSNFTYVTCSIVLGKYSLNCTVTGCVENVYVTNTGTGNVITLHECKNP